MHQTYIKESVDPFKLFAAPFSPPSSSSSAVLQNDTITGSSSNQNTIINKISSTLISEQVINKSKSSSQTITNASSITTTTLPIDYSFVSRYEDEIASAAKIKEYKAIGTKHKESLMKEAYHMQTKFKNDIVEAKQVEQTVEGISNMLTQFTQILRGQTGLVDELYETALDATDFVSQADKELQLTIKRSTSHSRNIMFLALGLAVLLLLLDFITP